MKQTGVSTSGVEHSARYRRKVAKRRRAEEQAWAAKNGPTLLRLGGYEVYAKGSSARSIREARELLMRAIAGEQVEGVSRTA